MRDLGGLRLTKSERILVIALSYAFCLPTLYRHGKNLAINLASLLEEARTQVRDEQQHNQPQRPQEV